MSRNVVARRLLFHHCLIVVEQLCKAERRGAGLRRGRVVRARVPGEPDWGVQGGS